MPTPILDKAQQTLHMALFWFAGCLVVAIGAGIAVHPPVSYTVGAAVIGVVWSALLVAFWRLRPNWSLIATVVLFLGLSLVRDFTFPGPGFLRGIYGGATAIATSMLLLRLFRRPIAKFCRLDRHKPDPMAGSVEDPVK